MHVDRFIGREDLMSIACFIFYLIIEMQFGVELASLWILFNFNCQCIKCQEHVT